MVSRDDGNYVIWPVYFDKNSTRLQGRKISRNKAVEKPDVEQISKAAKSLGFHAIIEKEKSHPARHWKKDGRVLVEKKKESKTQVLQMMASRL